MTANYKIFGATVLAASLAIGGITGGCGGDDDSYRDRGYERERRVDTYPDRSYDDGVRDGDDYRVRDRDSDRPRRPSRQDVPRGAVQIDESSERSMKHEPKHPGQAFVYDVDDEYTLYETRLRPGDRLVVDPDRDVIKLNAVPDGKVNFRKGHRYRLYYLRDDEARSRRERY
jgi:hypothetical protein